MFVKQLLVYLFLSLTFFSFAGKIERAFQKLSIYNYFEAKVLFEKTLKKKPVPSNYGLAIIYFRNDNPFHNLDSAYVFVNRAEALFEIQKEKEKQKMAAYGCTYPEIRNLRQAISAAFYKIALESNTELSFQHFLDQHPWADEVQTSIYKRDSIAFELAKDFHASKQYNLFMKKYPESIFQTQALASYRLTLYQEKTKTGTVEELLSFINTYPDNPYKDDAEDRVYNMLTDKNRIIDYLSFIEIYPANKNRNGAWRRLYQLYMYDYSETRIDQFLTEYPNYPFQNEVLQDKEIALQNLLPFRKGSLFGWMDFQGSIVYSPEYESMGLFREGLSLVSKYGKFGYVDKGNQVVIPMIYDAGFDFEQGRAIVEKNGKSGIIDRTGKLLFEIDFEDIGQFSEGLIYATKDSLYGYYDKYGVQHFNTFYQEAFSFSDGMAMVQVQGKQTFIDLEGKYVIAPIYEQISKFTDSLFIFEEEELFGIVHRNGKIITPAIYDEIGKLTNQRAVVMSNDKIGYLNEFGIEVIKPTFDVFPNFMENARFSGKYAKARFKNKYGVIDANGKWIIPATYTDLGNISNLMAFTKGKGWGFIDLQNKVIHAPKYDYAESMTSGLAVAELLVQQGMINAKGDFIIPNKFSNIERLENGYYLTSDGAKLGVYSPKGKELVTTKYQQVRILDEEFMLLSNPGEIHYLYLPEGRIIIPNLIN
jgi:hypothetical protein